MPGVRLQIRSKFLHILGAEKALLWCSNRLEEMGILTRWTVNRLDPYTDVQGWNPEARDRPNFLTRTGDVHYFEKDDSFSGFTLRTYTHLMPTSDEAAKNAFSDLF